MQATIEPKTIPARAPADSPLVGDEDPPGGTEELVGIADTDTAIVELEDVEAAAVTVVEMGIRVELEDDWVVLVVLVPGTLELVEDSLVVAEDPLVVAEDPLVVVEEVPIDDGIGVGVRLSLADMDVDEGAEVPVVAVESPSTEAALDRNGAALRIISWQSTSLSACLALGQLGVIANVKLLQIGSEYHTMFRLQLYSTERRMTRDKLESR